MYINNKTIFSLLEATTKQEQLIDFAIKNKIPAIGICDFGTSQGFYSFSKLANNKGVTAILAVDTFVMYKNISHNVLLICNGNESLFEINKALSAVNNNQLLDYDQLVDTIVVFKDINVQIENERDYIGITKNDIVTYNLEIKENYLLIDETLFFNKTDFDYFKVISAIKDNTTINRVRIDNKRQKYVHLEDQDLIEYDSLYTNYLNLVNKLESINYEESFKLPSFTVKNEISSNEYLYKLMYAGLKRRLDGTITEEYANRLKYEYDVICSLNFADYFLIVWDIIKFCKSESIYVGPGRGSAAGSLLAYCLGITNVDPIKHDLLFERFLNPKRKTMPDIDLDFEDTKRDQIIEYIINKYGEDYVCQIGTLSTFQAKSSFREVAKAVDLHKSMIDSVSKLIDSSMSFKQNMHSNKKLSSMFMSDTKLKFILDYIYQIEDVPKNRSIHAAGIIIGDRPINYYTSVHSHVSDVDSKTLEQIGLVKFDILAISNLRHLHALEDEIKKERNITVNFNQINFEDKNVYNALSDGMSNFVFQLESAGMISTLRKYRPRCFDDLAALLALYRPGPMQYIDEYISRKEGKSKPEYIDPSLEIILAPTYGIIVYQEQIMQIVQLMAKYDLGQADIFRRAISKKDKDLIDRELEKFVVNAQANGYSKEVSEEAAKRILAFANYGFNKSHAYSYAKISYALMYYKVNYPDVYFSYYLKILRSKADMAKFDLDLQYFELELTSPSLSNPSYYPIMYKGKLQLGLDSLVGIDNQFKDNLLNYVKTNGSDVIGIIDNVIVPAKLSTQEVTKLVCSGLFSYSGYNERSLVEYITSKDEFQDVDALMFMDVKTTIDMVDNYKIVELEKYEREALNINIRFNSYDEYFTKLKEVYPFIKRLNEVSELPVRSNFDTLVYVENLKEIKTKNGKIMGFMDVKVNGQDGSITVFPDSYMRLYDDIVDKQGYAIVNVEIINNGYSLQKIKFFRR